MHLISICTEYSNFAVSSIRLRCAKFPLLYRIRTRKPKYSLQLLSSPSPTSAALQIASERHSLLALNLSNLTNIHYFSSLLLQPLHRIIMFHFQSLQLLVLGCVLREFLEGKNLHCASPGFQLTLCIHTIENRFSRGYGGKQSIV